MGFSCFGKNIHAQTHILHFLSFFVSIKIGSEFAECILRCTVLSFIANIAIAVFSVLAQPHEIILLWRCKTRTFYHVFWYFSSTELYKYILSKNTLGVAAINHASGQLYLYELTCARRSSASSRGPAQVLGSLAAWVTASFIHDHQAWIFNMRYKCENDKVKAYSYRCVV